MRTFTCRSTFLYGRIVQGTQCAKDIYHIRDFSVRHIKKITSKAVFWNVWKLYFKVLNTSKGFGVFIVIYLVLAKTASRVTMSPHMYRPCAFFFWSLCPLDDASPGRTYAIMYHRVRQYSDLNLSFIYIKVIFNGAIQCLCSWCDPYRDWQYCTYKNMFLHFSNSVLLFRFFSYAF